MLYHISSDGLTRICKAASAEACRAKAPNGLPTEHFDNLAEANRKAEKMAEERHGKTTTVRKPRKTTKKAPEKKTQKETEAERAEKLRSYRRPVSCSTGGSISSC